MLQKSFGRDERNFLEPWMLIVSSDVRDHIASQKNDHGASYPLLQSIATMESSKHQRLRDFWRRSIFDFCNTIGMNRTDRAGLAMSVDWGKPECAGRPARSRWCKSITMKE